MTGVRDVPPEPRSHPADSDCPPSEQISAYLDGRLEGPSRVAIEDHVSRCEDCYFLVRETLLTLPALGEPAAGDPSAARRLPRLWLAIAATVFVSLGSGTAWWLLWRDANAAAIADLAEQVRDRRFFEARLTGGFRHGPLVGVKRAANTDRSDQWGVLGKALEIIEREERAPSPKRRALAAARLFYSKVGAFKPTAEDPDPRGGEVDAAVESLETLAREHPEDSRLQSDLAAAYLVRAEGAAPGDDARKALEAASAAIRLEPTLREAHFNRALALESLQRTDEAIRAWEEYRSAFPGDEWLPAASAHLERLRSP